MSLLVTQNLNVAAGGHALIQNLNWQVKPGEFWCVLGQNGVGKSTLLHVLAGLLPAASGRSLIHGQPINRMRAGELARLRGLLPQKQVDAFSYTALEAVLIGRTPYRVGAGWDSGEDIALALDALKRVGLEDKAKEDITHLSGGERQRVALASLLLQAPQLMLLDEPTSHQDVAHQLDIMKLIRELSSSHAVIATCHDINLAARFASHVLVLALARGRHWQGPVAEVLTTDILQQAFGCRFSRVDMGGLPHLVAF